MSTTPDTAPAETHPYFVDKARSLFANASGDPDRAGPLAAWAETARATGDSRVGVIVTEDGEIVAETRYVPTRGSGATYCTSSPLPDAQGFEAGVVKWELGWALASLGRITGRKVIHVKYSEVCQGAGLRRMGRPPKHTEPLVPVTLRLPESIHQAVTAAAAAASRSMNDEIIARCQDSGRHA